MPDPANAERAETGKLMSQFRPFPGPKESYCSLSYFYKCGCYGRLAFSILALLKRLAENPSGFSGWTTAYGRGGKGNIAASRQLVLF
jgi:hypothetical protein